MTLLSLLLGFRNGREIMQTTAPSLNYVTCKNRCIFREIYKQIGKCFRECRKKLFHLNQQLSFVFMLLLFLHRSQWVETRFSEKNNERKLISKSFLKIDVLGSQQSSQNFFTLFFNSKIYRICRPKCEFFKIISNLLTKTS